MNLKHMNQVELDTHLKSLASRERVLLHEILMTLKEIDQRRTYLDLGYSNLFTYLVEGVGYSAGSAQRRIDAARVLCEIPEIGEKIKSGELKLYQVSLVQKATREISKTRSKKVSSEDKRQVLETLTNKNPFESEKEVASFFDLPVFQKTKQKVQANESVRIELTLSKELFDDIQKAQGLLSHALPTKDLVKYLEYLTHKVIKSKTPKTPTKAPSPPSTATVAGKGFSEKIKKQVLHTQHSCQYIDPMTQKKCESRWFLQVDHKQSLWAQGKSDLPNAQVLCSSHNQLKYRREVGIRYV